MNETEKLVKEAHKETKLIIRATDVYEGINTLLNKELDAERKKELKEDLLKQLDELKEELLSYSI